MDLKELLTQHIVVKKNGSKEPLFKFQSDIARAIQEEVKNYSKRESDNLRVYLNQVLKRGGEKYKKPLSSEMRAALLEVVNSRLSEDDPLYDDLEAKFDEAYEELNHIPDEIEDDTKEYKRFQKWQTSSQRILIFDRKPREVTWLEDFEDSHDPANENNGYYDSGDLLNTMFNNIFKNYEGTKEEIVAQLLDYKSGTEGTPAKLPVKKALERNEQVQYQFFVPSEEMAIRLWQSHLVFLIHYLGVKPSKVSQGLVSHICSFLRALNKKSKTRGAYTLKSFIRVFVVPPYLVTVPLAYYESINGVYSSSKSKLKSKEALYSVIVRNKDLVQISELDKKTRNFWKSSILHPIMLNETNPFQPVEIRFKNVQPGIRRTNTIYQAFERD